MVNLAYLAYYHQQMRTKLTSLLTNTAVLLLILPMASHVYGSAPDGNFPVVEVATPQRHCLGVIVSDQQILVSASCIGETTRAQDLQILLPKAQHSKRRIQKVALVFVPNRFFEAKQNRTERGDLALLFLNEQIDAPYKAAPRARSADIASSIAERQPLKQTDIQLMIGNLESRIEVAKNPQPEIVRLVTDLGTVSEIKFSSLAKIIDIQDRPVFVKVREQYCLVAIATRFDSEGITGHNYFATNITFWARWLRDRQLEIEDFQRPEGAP